MSKRSLLRLLGGLTLVLIGLLLAPVFERDRAPRIARAQRTQLAPASAGVRAGAIGEAVRAAPAPAASLADAEPAASAPPLAPGSFEVLVLDDAGRALHGARIELCWSERAREHGLLDSGTTDLRGLWRGTAPPLERWPLLEREHRDLRLRASRAGHRPSSIDLSVLDLRHGKGRFELRLAPGASLRGRVVDERGQPVQGAFAFVGPVTDDPPGEGSSGQLANDRTDRTGAFELRLDITHGPVWLRASRLGTGFSRTQRFELSLEGDREHELRLEAGLALRGRVVYPDGSPAPRTQLRAVPLEVSDHAGIGWSDEQGRFTVPALRDTEYTLSLDGWPAQEAASEPPRYRPPQDGITFVTALCGLTLFVREFGGEPLNGVQIRCFEFSEVGGVASVLQREGVTTQGDPPRALVRLEPGSTHVFRVEAVGCHPTQVEYRAPDVAQADQLVLELHGRERLARVRPQFPSGAAQTAAWVDVYDPWTRLRVVEGLRPDAQGLLPGLAPGRWILAARRSEQVGPTTLPEGLGTPVELRPDVEQPVWLTLD